MFGIFLYALTTLSESQQVIPSYERFFLGIDGGVVHGQILISFLRSTSSNPSLHTLSGECFNRLAVKRQPNSFCNLIHESGRAGYVFLGRFGI